MRFRITYHTRMLKFKFYEKNLPTYVLLGSACWAESNFAKFSVIGESIFSTYKQFHSLHIVVPDSSIRWIGCKSNIYHWSGRCWKPYGSRWVAMLHQMGVELHLVWPTVMKVFQFCQNWVTLTAQISKNFIRTIVNYIFLKSS